MGALGMAEGSEAAGIVSPFLLYRIEWWLSCGRIEWSFCFGGIEWLRCYLE